MSAHPQIDSAGNSTTGKLLLFLLHAGFALTGAMTVLLGPILPLLQSRWDLLDVQAGGLFTAQFTATVFGAAISLLNPRRSMIAGFAAIAGGSSLLAFSTYRGGLAALVLMGFGLGLSITPINLMVSNVNTFRRGASLSLLNACWGLGAGLTPQFVDVALRYASLQALLCMLAGCSLVIPIALLIDRRPLPGASTAKDELPAEQSQFSIFALFAVLLFCYVGAENSISGWVSTYAGRIGGVSMAFANLLVSLFWISIVLVRLLMSWVLRVSGEVRAQLIGLAVALVGIAMLIFGHTATAFGVGVVLGGSGFAPVFPVSSSLFFARIRSTRYAGLVFAICGFGGAVLPWLVGFISTQSGSLRLAFLVPAAATAVVLLLTLVAARPVGPPD